MPHYYNQKYPYLQYSYCDTDWFHIMFSIPPKLLATKFEQTFGYAPKSFFDCGAATGKIVMLAQELGMDARGIDIKEYPQQSDIPRELFKTGKIQIKSILDCEPIKSDLAFCNGTLTYFSENELPHVLDKFKYVKMLCAIHNTTEDIVAARNNGDELTDPKKPRLIKPQQWWMETFDKNGFKTEYDTALQCFCAVPQSR